MALDFINKIRHYSKSEQVWVSDQALSDDNYNRSHQRNPSALDQSRPFALFGPMPPFTSVLGICNDGLPLLLDLSNPEPGAILITGQRQSGKSELLRSIIFSACMLNTTEQLYFYFITPNPGNNKDIGRFDHCYGLFSSYDKAACELVVDLAAHVEQRKNGRHIGVKCILAIDNLYELIKHRDFEVINHLKWLFRYGTNNGIWVISTLESERTNLIEDSLLEEQKTHIVSGNQNLMLSDPDSQNNLPQLNQGYRTRIGMEMVNFWLPSLR